MESSVISSLREHLEQRTFLFLISLSSFPVQKSREKILPQPSKSMVGFTSWNWLLWCCCSRSIDYCYLKMTDRRWRTGGLDLHFGSLTHCPVNSFKRMYWRKERWRNMRFGGEQGKRGIQLCPPWPTWGWREGEAGLFSEEQLERMGTTGTSCRQGNFDLMSVKTSSSLEVFSSWNGGLGRLWDTQPWRY